MLLRSLEVISPEFVHMSPNVKSSIQGPEYIYLL